MSWDILSCGRLLLGFQMALESYSIQGWNSLISWKLIDIGISFRLRIHKWLDPILQNDHETRQLNWYLLFDIFSFFLADWKEEAYIRTFKMDMLFIVLSGNQFTLLK